MNHTQFNLWLRQSFKNRDLLTTVVSDSCRILLLGYRVEPDETEVFGGPSGKLIKDTLKRLQVPIQVIAMGYVCKLKKMAVEEESHWGEITGREINCLRPRSVILFGEKAAHALLGTVDLKLEDMRRVHYQHHNFPNTNFFVTHDPADVVKDPDGIVGATGQNMVSDMVAVFQVTREYFVSMVEL
jgi:uracil-DNA glycosylase